MCGKHRGLRLETGRWRGKVDPTPPRVLHRCENKGVAGKGICKCMKIKSGVGGQAGRGICTPRRSEQAGMKIRVIDDGRGQGERRIIGWAAENGAWSGLEIDDHDSFY